MTRNRESQRGTILGVILFIATAIAALAAITSGRVVSETRMQRTMEQETRAYNEAYAQLQLALNVVNNSSYNDTNQNLELKAAMDGDHGGTAGSESDDHLAKWLHDPEDVVHGKIRGTDVRVYRGKDYLKRIAFLKGESFTDPDPDNESRSYYVIEAAGRSGDTTRLVSALIRENQPFSSFVFFQNRHPLGVSGAPRGLIHSNDQLQFYFPNGNYTDSVSAVNGFGYEAGATEQNTAIADGNPEATEIRLDEADFTRLRTKADLYVGGDDLDAEIKLRPDGQVRIKQYTQPRWEQVEHTYEYETIVGYETRTETQTQQVQVGTTTEERTRTVQTGTTTEEYEYTWQEQVGTTTEERTRTVQTGTTTEERTRDVPVYDTRTVTCTRQVRVFVPYDDGSGGTAVGGGADGVAGEYEWVTEEYECEETYVSGHTTETYTVEVPVYGEETYTVDVPVYETRTEMRTREVPVYGEETYTVEVPVYEDQQVEVEVDYPIYETRQYTYHQWEHFPAEYQSTEHLPIPEKGGTIFIPGRITKLHGQLKGRLTIVGDEKVRVTGNLQYVDDDGDTAMVNGTDYSQEYRRNENYDGHSVLGVIARDDILFTHNMPSRSEVNATLLSATGRVGISGFEIDDNGEPVKDHYHGLTWDEMLVEAAYDYTNYETRTFRKNSLRRLGGIVSNDRILETFIGQRNDGTAYVDAGFKRGRMRYDFNLLFNPPPNFVEVPRPVVTSIVPVYFVRNGDDE